MELGPRDRLSQAFVKEDQKGRTVSTEYGSVVHLDLRHLGAKLINAKLPFVRELCMKYENIDPVKELIPVRPVVHYMMGGVSTDIHGATPLDGLFAAGEAACVSINGANRLGSNSLTECLVFGARAGQAAAEFAIGKDVPDRGVLAQATDEQKRLEQQYLRKNGGKERIATLREEMQKAVEGGAGIYREQSTLSQAKNKLFELQERYVNIKLDDHSQTFNTELISALELGFMLDVAQSIVECALHRTESRGAHQRTDFPERDDKRFLAHSLARRDGDGSLKVEYLPVKITRWPPGERVYGQEEKKTDAIKQAG
jgi:fumarate reductase flavoprotein subunit